MTEITLSRFSHFVSNGRAILMKGLRWWCRQSTEIVELLGSCAQR
jgi:hypothetical protein